MYRVMRGLQQRIDARPADTSTDNSATLSLHQSSQRAADQALLACSARQN